MAYPLEFLLKSQHWLLSDLPLIKALHQSKYADKALIKM